MTWGPSVQARNDALDSILGKIDAGTPPGLLRIYGGTRPTDADTAVTTQTLLAEVTLANPAFAPASAGSAALTDPGAVTGLADGTATWCRFVPGGAAAGAAGVLDGDVGTELTLNTTTISAGVAFDITGGTITHP